MKTLNIQYNRQRGSAALLVAVILLFASTLIVLYAGKVGVQDQRISGNDYRAKQAFSNAEAGLEHVAGRLMNGTLTYTSTLYQPTSYIGAAPYYKAGLHSVGGSPVGAIEIQSTGYAEFMNSNATATVRQSFGFNNLFGEGPDAPMIVAGPVPPQGNMEIVGNPNGAGTGVNVAVWTSDPVVLSGSQETCQRAEYESNGTVTAQTTTGDFNVCAANDCSCHGTLDGKISYGNLAGGPVIGADIVANDPNFPDDIFAYVFGIPADQYETVRDKRGTTIVANCNGLNATSHGIYWVTGTCSLPVGTNVGGGNCGTVADPVLCAVVVVVDNGNVNGGNGNLYGILYMFDNPDISGLGTASMNGNTAIYGAFVADHPVCAAGNCFTGSFDVVYERAVFQAIANDKTNQLLSRVAGTWIDQ